MQKSSGVPCRAEARMGSRGRAPRARAPGAVRARVAAPIGPFSDISPRPKKKPSLAAARLRATQVKKRQSKKEQEKRARMKTFVKVVNYNHLMPTRYTMDADLKSIVTADVVDNEAKRTEAKKESKKVLEERFQTGKNRWFFTKLRF